MNCLDTYKGYLFLLVLSRELYSVAVQELIFTTVASVASVCFVGFVMLPHWSGVLFVGPLIIMLYFNLLGILRFCGIYINAVTYVTIVIRCVLMCAFTNNSDSQYQYLTGSPTSLW